MLRFLTVGTILGFGVCMAASSSSAPVPGCAVPTRSIVELDCRVDGPYTDSSGTPAQGAPQITDTGTLASATRAGFQPPCDGCTFHYEFLVTWHHTGEAWTVDDDGDWTGHTVTVGETTTIAGTATTPCNSEMRVDGITPNGGCAGVWKCKDCTH